MSGPVVLRRRNAPGAVLPTMQIASQIASRLGGMVGQQLAKRMRQTNNNLPTGLVQSRPAARRTRTVNRTRRRNNRSVQRTSAPISYGISSLGGKPRYRSSSIEGGCIVSNHEIIYTPEGSPTFSVDAFAMIPANFAWLKGVAANWSRFRWLRLQAQFMTASSTTTNGNVAMGATYSTIDSAPETMREMAALAHSFVGPVWGTQGQTICTVNFDPTRWSKPWYNYLETPDLESGELDQYIPAWLQFAVQSGETGAIGQIMLSYEIELLDPIPARMNITPASFATVKTFHKKYKPEADTTLPPTKDDMLISLFKAVQLQLEGGRVIPLIDDEQDSKSDTKEILPQIDEGSGVQVSVPTGTGTQKHNRKGAVSSTAWIQSGSITAKK